jgi:hypothetical protein
VLTEAGRTLVDDAEIQESIEAHPSVGSRCREVVS